MQCVLSFPNIVSSELKVNSLQVNGAKTLVLDPTLAGPLGLVTEVALLKVFLYIVTRLIV